MAYSAAAWSKEAENYQKVLKMGSGKGPMAPAYDLFAEDVGTHLKQRTEVPARVLDVACGPGQPGLTLLAQLPTAEVTFTDKAQVRDEHRVDDPSGMLCCRWSARSYHKVAERSLKLHL